MNESKIKKSFKLVKEDFKDIYKRINEVNEKIEEMRVTQLSILDKLVKKADKKPARKTSKKKKR